MAGALLHLQACHVISTASPKLGNSTHLIALHQSVSLAVVRPSHGRGPGRNPFLGAALTAQPLSYPTCSFSGHSVRCQVSETAAESSVQEEKEVRKNESSNGALATWETKSSKTLDLNNLPSGEMVYKSAEGFERFMQSVRMFFAWPWQKFKKGSVLCLKVSGALPEQLGSRFSPVTSLTQLCQNLKKAAHDPRVSGVYLKIEPLACGWGKVEELRRHIQYFRKSGKFTMAYLATGGEKEYLVASACEEIYAPPGAYVSLRGLTVQGQFLGGVLEKVGVEPQVQRFGKYKSAGDQLSRKDMSPENREMLTALLNDLYEKFVTDMAASRPGKSIEDVEALLDEGVFDMDQLKEKGWITDIKYEDELEDLLKTRTGGKADKVLAVNERKYNRVQEKTLGLRGRNRIAVLRASGSISRGKGMGSGEGIANESFIAQVRRVRENKGIKAVVLRIDSPGGDALASDLMWRELRILAKEKPVIASMVDVAASGGYYMAMGCDAIVAEPLTLTGSIGVVTAKFNLKELYERIGFAKELISKGRFAQLEADNRPFTEEEEDYFKRSARKAYESFRGKAALSRNMEVERMEAVAQGRVWSGKAALQQGLVDALGGFSTALAIAKQAAGISQNDKVTLVEFSRSIPSIRTLLTSGLVSDEASVSSLSQWLQVAQAEAKVLASGAPQARMDPIVLDGVGLQSSQALLEQDLKASAGEVLLLLPEVLSEALRTS